MSENRTFSACVVCDIGDARMFEYLHQQNTDTDAVDAQGKTLFDSAKEPKLNPVPKGSKERVNFVKTLIGFGFGDRRDRDRSASVFRAPLGVKKILNRPTPILLRSRDVDPVGGSAAGGRGR